MKPADRPATLIAAAAAFALCAVVFAQAPKRPAATGEDESGGKDGYVQSWAGVYESAARKLQAVDFEALRRAIRDMERAFPKQYAKAAESLERAAAHEKRRPAVLAALKKRQPAALGRSRRHSRVPALRPCWPIRCWTSTGCWWSSASRWAIRAGRGRPDYGAGRVPRPAAAELLADPRHPAGHSAGTTRSPCSACGRAATLHDPPLPSPPTSGWSATSTCTSTPTGCSSPCPATSERWQVVGGRRRRQRPAPAHAGRPARRRQLRRLLPARRPDRLHLDGPVAGRAVQRGRRSWA